MKERVKAAHEGSLSAGQRKKAIRDAVRRHRRTTPAPPHAFPACRTPVTVGSTVSFFDSRGRFASGTVIDDDSFRVLATNIATTRTVLCKSPYMSWEEALRVVGGSTLIKPRDLLGFTRMMMDDVDTENAPDEPEVDESEDDDSAYRRGA